MHDKLRAAWMAGNGRSIRSIADVLSCPRDAVRNFLRAHTLQLVEKKPGQRIVVVRIDGETYARLTRIANTVADVETVEAAAGAVLDEIAKAEWGAALENLVRDGVEAGP